MVRELGSICEELELNWSFLSHFSVRDLQRCHKQAGCSVSPGHHAANTELQILARFSSNFVAIFYALFIGCSSKEEGQLF